MVYEHSWNFINKGIFTFLSFFEGWANLECLNFMHIVGLSLLGELFFSLLVLQ